jgi:hypothetical protein
MRPGEAGENERAMGASGLEPDVSAQVDRNAGCSCVVEVAHRGASRNGGMLASNVE